MNRRHDGKNVRDRMKRKLISQQKNKICLSMIVRNESKNMNRLLDSLSQIIDMISIVDTGSTDNTEEVIIKWGQEHQIPTTVHHEPFKNFSHNRTHSFQMAKKTYPEATYILLSDADFVWEIDNFDRKQLIEDCYILEQYNKSLSYWNVRILKSSINFVCVGVTHEYWECQDRRIERSKILSLRIHDLEDGGCKDDKFDRDERLLREAILDPKTKTGLRSRYRFYLAQTLKDTNRHEESIKLYQERINDGGWEEEIFYSKYQIALQTETIAKEFRTLSEYLNNPINGYHNNLINKYQHHKYDQNQFKNESEKHFNKAIEKYREAFNYRKCRAEPLFNLSELYRNLGNHKAALTIAKLGKSIPFPKNDILFVGQFCYEYGFDFQIAMSAPMINRTKEGRESYNRLIKTNLSEYYQNNLKFISKYYQ